MIQEVNDIKNVGTEQYSFVSRTIESVDGVGSFGPQDGNHAIPLFCHSKSSGSNFVEF